MENNDFDLLELICQEVEWRKIDIATNYSDWVILTYGLVTDFGEEGRPYFHRICRLYADGYSPEDCERMYDYALEHSRGQAHFASICHLAKCAGIDLDALREKIKKRKEAERQRLEKASRGKKKRPQQANNGGLSCCPVVLEDKSHMQCDDDSGGESSFSSPPTPVDGYAAGGEDRCLPGSEPLRPLPVLYQGSYTWPKLLNQTVSLADDEPQRDALLLGALTLIGAAIGPDMQARYSHKPQYPNLQTFVVARPASGKGVLGFARRLTDALHDKIRQAYHQEFKNYRKQHNAWVNQRRRREEADEPEEPLNRLFYIPGDNTGTGIVQNLCDNDGRGMLFEEEADTLTSAIQGDYGKFSDVLRKAFDHDGLSYNRRTNQEYRECDRTNLSVLITGTPAQVPPLIPSSENGLFSREVFYYMPTDKEFRDMLDDDDDEQISFCQQLGQQMLSWLEVVRAAGPYVLALQPDQHVAFYSEFKRLYDHSQKVDKGEMDSFVKRQPINIIRMMTVVALLRATEPTYIEVERTGQAPTILLYDPSLLKTAEEARRKGITSGYVVYIRDDDFRQVLSMAEPLYKHALHVLSFLPETEINRRTLSEEDRLFADLDNSFTSHQASELAQERGLNPSTVRNWISRWQKAGMIGKTGVRGEYQKLVLSDIGDSENVENDCFNA